MWRNAIMLAAVAALVGSGCTGSSKEGTPQRVLADYISTTFGVKAPADKARLLEFTTGEVKATLEKLDDESFKHHFIDDIKHIVFDFIQYIIFNNIFNDQFHIFYYQFQYHYFVHHFDQLYYVIYFFEHKLEYYIIYDKYDVIYNLYHQLHILKQLKYLIFFVIYDNGISFYCAGT